MKPFSVVARDVHSPLVRNEIWVHFADIWPTVFNLPRPYVGIRSQKNVIQYLIELDSWQEARNVLRSRIEADPKELGQIIRLSEEWGKDMNAFTQAIHDADLSTWTSAALINAYNTFFDFQARQYAVGVLLPLMDIGGESFIESFIKKLLQERVEEGNQQQVFTILTSPVKDSFAGEQEKALLMLATEFGKDEAVRKRLVEKSPHESWQLLIQHPDAAQKIRAHAKTHGWVYYVYQGPAFEEPQFVEFLQQIFKKPEAPEVALARRLEEQARLAEEQREWIEKLAQTPLEQELLTLASEYVWSKPRRKDYQSRSYFHVERFFREWARRTGASLRHARAARREQIIRALKGECISLSELESQYQLHVVTNERVGGRIEVAAEAAAFTESLILTEHADSQTDASEWHGSTAYPGTVRGNVRIVNTPEDMQAFKEGEILVSIATTPSIVPAMKKAAAILTDEGGLTCHAAIVSRELQIPCVVGLKCITATIKTGDELEVDATNAIVRRV